MKFYSPLRYPGGKNKLAKFISLICVRNNINGHYVEPYAGGASVALYLLMNGYVDKITINDKDRAIYAFWYSVLHYNEKLCNKIKTTPVTMESWEKYKKIYDNKKYESLFDLGFATFFLNRTNHSGIIDGGVIGGKDQKGNYKIDCRFNKKDLIRRIKLIAKYKSKINLSNLDALDLVKEIKKQSEKQNTIFYFDPPYYLKGPSLYMNHYKQIDHKKVSKKIQNIKGIRWIVSYDNVPEIEKLYSRSRKKEYSFFHTAQEIKKAEEFLFFSRDLIIPRILEPTKV